MQMLTAVTDSTPFILDARRNEFSHGRLPRATTSATHINTETVINDPIFMCILYDSISFYLSS